MTPEGSAATGQHRATGPNEDQAAPTARPYTPATVDEWRAAYEAKVDDLARETLRTSALSGAARRLWEAYCAACRQRGASEVQVARFVVRGFPPAERDALIDALALTNPADAEWIRRAIAESGTE